MQIATGLLRRAVLIACVGACAGFAAAAAPVAKPAYPRALFYVGAAKEDVTPTSLHNFYLGGYGIGPMHEARSVLRHIYFRVMAIRDQSGHQIVIGALDSQGYLISYQNGPYGFNNIEQYIQAHLGIPASHIILQATHDHNGPDEIGIWGGVPNAYFARVTHEMEVGIERAVKSERPALLKVGTADMTGFSGTFGSGTDPSNTGDNADYPIDHQLRVLEAISPSSRKVLATLVNYSTHATIYGPLDKVAPDWPGSTATYLEHDQQGMPAGARYGYPGSTAIVTVGAMGHTWPARVPAGDTHPGVDPPKASDNNFPADQFGNAVAQQAIDAVAGGHGFFVRQSLVAGTTRNVSVENTNPVLLAAETEPSNSTPAGGLKIDRNNMPPWQYGDIFVSHVSALRVGSLVFYGVPGEPYPSIKFSLDRAVHSPVQFIFGLANDQLGYVEKPSDYTGAFQCSTSDEWFFTISPVFGSSVVRLSGVNAKALGFHVRASALKPYAPGKTPPSTNCTQQQVSQGSGGLPVG